MDRCESGRIRSPRRHPVRDVVASRRECTVATSAAWPMRRRPGGESRSSFACRWHLWHNLAEQVEKTIAAHHSCLREQEIPPEVPPFLRPRIWSRRPRRYIPPARATPVWWPVQGSLRADLGVEGPGQGHQADHAGTRAGQGNRAHVLPSEQCGGGDGDLPRRPAQRARRVQTLPARAVHRRSHQRQRAVLGDPQAGLPRQSGHGGRLPRTVSRRRRHTRVQARRAEGPARHLVDAAPPRPLIRKGEKLAGGITGQHSAVPGTSRWPRWRPRRSGQRYGTKARTKFVSASFAVIDATT